MDKKTFLEVQYHAERIADHLFALQQKLCTVAAENTHENQLEYWLTQTITNTHSMVKILEVMGKNKYEVKIPDPKYKAGDKVIINSKWAGGKIHTIDKVNGFKPVIDYDKLEFNDKYEWEYSCYWLSPHPKWGDIPIMMNVSERFITKIEEVQHHGS